MPHIWRCHLWNRVTFFCFPYYYLFINYLFLTSGPFAHALSVLAPDSIRCGFILKQIWKHNTGTCWRVVKWDDCICLMMTPHQPVILWYWLFHSLTQAGDPRFRVFVCSQTLWIGALLLPKTLSWVRSATGSGRERGAVSVTTRMPGVFGLDSVWSPALWKAVWLIRLWVVIQQSDSPRWAALSCNPRGVKDISAIWCLNNVSHVIGLKRLNGLTSWLLVKWLTCDKITETAQCEGKHNTRTTCSVCGRSSERNTPGQLVEEASSALRATESHIWSPMGVSPRGAWTPYWSSA